MVKELMTALTLQEGAFSEPAKVVTSQIHYLKHNVLQPWLNKPATKQESESVCRDADRCLLSASSQEKESTAHLNISCSNCLPSSEIRTFNVQRFKKKKEKEKLVESLM